jgi:hypothetical protein
MNATGYSKFQYAVYPVLELIGCQRNGKWDASRYLRKQHQCFFVLYGLATNSEVDLGEHQRHFGGIHNVKLNVEHHSIPRQISRGGLPILKIYPLSKRNFLQFNAFSYSDRLLTYDFQCAYRGDYASNSEDTQDEIRERFRRNEATEIRWRIVLILVCLPGGICLLCYTEFVYVDRIHINRAWRRRLILWGLRIAGTLLISVGMLSGGLPVYWDYDATYGNAKHVSHDCTNQILKNLTCNSYKTIQIKYLTNHAI